jgi:hypothetical protein
VEARGESETHKITSRLNSFEELLFAAMEAPCSSIHVTQAVCQCLAVSIPVWPGDHRSSLRFFKINLTHTWKYFQSKNTEFTEISRTTA